jgi:hypothetical protein
MRSLSVVVSVAVVALGCDDKPKATVDAAPPIASAKPPPPPSPPPPKCRVMQSENGLPPSADPTKWVDLPDKSASTVRVTETGIEIRFEGPGRARPCAEDYAILAGGSASVAPGGGGGPGVETWIATPCGVVRFSGVHRVTVEPNVCRVKSSMGPAFVYPANDAKLTADGGAPAIENDGWSRIDAPKIVELRIKPGTNRFPPMLERCNHIVSDASNIANRMLGQGPDARDPTLAAQSVLARRAARASCATAAAIAGAAGDIAKEEAAVSAFSPLR